GGDVQGALALLSSPPPHGASPGARPRAGQRPRELWSTSHSVFSRLERGSIVPPRSFEPGPGSAPNERWRVSHTPSTVALTPALPPSALTDAVTPPARRTRPWLLRALLLAA